MWKWRSTYHFVENSAYFALKIESLLTMLSNFEREAALKGSAFWWVTCLIHKVLWYVYSLIVNLTGLTLHMVWYIQYLWWLLVQWSWTKQRNRWRTWRGLCWREFQLAKVKFDRVGEEGSEALGMENCSINIWDGSDLELALSKNSSSYFENNFPIFLLSSILNSSIHRVHRYIWYIKYNTLSKFLRPNEDLL